MSAFLVKGMWETVFCLRHVERHLTWQVWICFEPRKFRKLKIARAPTAEGMLWKFRTKISIKMPILKLLQYFFLTSNFCNASLENYSYHIEIKKYVSHIFDRKTRKKYLTRNKFWSVNLGWIDPYIYNGHDIATSWLYYA